MVLECLMPSALVWALAAVYEVDRLEAETEAGVVLPCVLVALAAEPRVERAHK